jgi:protocatechuate 3,4-dioxygenase beta subunit
MDNDDMPVGKLLNRREVLKLFGLTGSALLVGGLAACDSSQLAEADDEDLSVLALPSCIVRPELSEGPFFVDEKLNRSDIRSDPTTGRLSAGLPLTLRFLVSQVGSSCSPLAGAQVDVWHCDVQGRYSDVLDGTVDTRGKKFLRGFQRTNANGVAQFKTIYPGWYETRAVHVHFKIRTRTGLEFSSQLFFNDAFTNSVYKLQPYARRGKRNVLNKDDGFFQEAGRQLTLKTFKNADGSYRATFTIGLADTDV